MAFCKFSSEFVISNQTAVDNLFINEFLPSAPAECVKVYLYGLYKCNSGTSYDNTIESFAKVLNLTEEEVEDAFLYWQEEGLVQIINTTPIEVRYIPLKNAINGVRKYKADEFTSFNAQVQELLPGRQITPTEYDEYYYLLKTKHFQQDALIMIIKYCTQIKGDNVGYKYILTVANNWAKDGIVTAKLVEERLLSFEQAGSDLEVLFKIFNIKRLASFEEKELLLKWQKELGFDFKTIEYVAKSFKNKGNFEKLNEKLLKYYEMKKLSIKEIEGYEKEKDAMYKLAKEVSRRIGVYYENLDPIVETYISKWLSFGHDEESILDLADYCFKHSIRTLEGVDNTILKLYKLGIVSKSSINEYIGELSQQDKQIKTILEELNISRLVTNQDRTFYKTWVNDWNISNELLGYAISLSSDKFQPMQYLNKILSTWHSKNVNTLEEAKAFPIETKEKISTNKGRSYKKEDLNALFDTLEEIEI